MIPLTDLIKTHRRKAGLSQAALAKLAGVGKTVVWDVEHGKESVKWDTLLRLFHVLNITVDWQSPLLKRIAANPSPSRSANAGSTA